MPIDFSTAMRIAREHRDKADKKSGIPSVIADDLVQELETGWVFFYESEEFLRTGDRMMKLYGNAPYIVRKSDGKLFVTGTARRTEFYVENFLKYGTPHPEEPGSPR